MMLAMFQNVSQSVNSALGTNVEWGSMIFYAGALLAGLFVAKKIVTFVLGMLAKLVLGSFITSAVLFLGGLGVVGHGLDTWPGSGPDPAGLSNDDLKAMVDTKGQFSNAESVKVALEYARDRDQRQATYGSSAENGESKGNNKWTMIFTGIGMVLAGGTVFLYRCDNKNAGAKA